MAFTDAECHSNTTFIEMGINTYKSLDIVDNRRSCTTFMHNGAKR